MASTPPIERSSPATTQANDDTSIPSAPHTSLLAGVGSVAVIADEREQSPALPLQNGDGGVLDRRRAQSSGALHDSWGDGDSKHDEKDAVRSDWLGGFGSPQSSDDASGRAAQPGGISPRALIRDADASGAGKLQAFRRRPSGAGVLLGGALGIVVGVAAVVGVAVATGGIGLVVVGALLGGATGAGAFGGGAGSALAAGQPQAKKALDTALGSLEDRGVRLSQEEAKRLAEITPAQWRDLLRVPRAYVADKDARQEQREALVAAAAKHGYAIVSRWRAFAKQLCQLTPDEARRLDRLTDRQRKALLDVPQAEEIANPRDPRTTRLIEIDGNARVVAYQRELGTTVRREIERDARREIREDLVLLAAKYGYEQTVAARDLMHVPRSQEVPGLKYGTTRRIEIDRAGRRALREHLVFNVARHDHARAAAEKRALVRMAAVGTLRGAPVDLDTLRRSVRGPDGKTLYGPYDGDLEDWIAEGFRSESLQGFTTVPDSQGLELCSESVGSITRKYKPELTKRTGEKVTLHVPGGWSSREKEIKDLKTIGATLADYVGDRNGDQAAVVKNLSAYLHRPFPMTGHLHNREGEWTHRVSSDRQNDLLVEESQDGEAYVLRYDERLIISSVSPAGEAMKEEAHGHVKASVAIRVRRADLAEGNREFEWVQRPRYYLQMTMGQAPPDGGGGSQDQEARS